VNEQWYRLRSRAVPRPVVALDVSAAAEPLWPVLLGTVEGLAEELPEPARPEVAFLGGTDRYPLDRFLRSADDLYRANRGRGRVVSPLLESFGSTWPARVVVVAVKPVWDLADWKGRDRLAVIRTDPTTSVCDGAFPETDLSDVAAVAGVVHRPVTAVRLGGGGAMPVGWDNPAFRFADGAVVADPNGRWDVTAGFAGVIDLGPATAVLVRSDGTTDRLPLEPADPPAEPGWVPFTAAELTALDAWKGNRSAHCPRCRADHPPGVVACPSGEVLLPSLARFAGGFVRVKVKMFQASYQPPRQTVPLPDGGVVARGDGPPAVWRYDPSELRWAPTPQPWGLFERVGDDEFALALPTRAGG
jgi:hypothetical protein